MIVNTPYVIYLILLPKRGLITPKLTQKSIPQIMYIESTDVSLPDKAITVTLLSFFTYNFKAVGLSTDDTPQIKADCHLRILKYALNHPMLNANDLLSLMALRARRLSR